MSSDQESDPNPDILPFVRPSLTRTTPPSGTTESIPPMRLGLLAGAGEFPIRFARGARNAGHYVYGLGIGGMASDDLAQDCDEFRYAPLARIGKAIRLFRKANVQRIVMAGKIEKTVLFHPFRWIRLMPDWRTLHMWYPSQKTPATAWEKRIDEIFDQGVQELDEGLVFGRVFGQLREEPQQLGQLSISRRGEWRN